MATAATAEQVHTLLLDPADILADDNSRYGLKKTRIESLMNSILELGEVTTAVEVEEREKPTKDAPQHYRLTAGFYRHAAALQLNTEKNAGVLLPARVVTVGDATTRLRRQLTENMERENQSPMDKAVAMKKLMDAGMSRGEIRRIFSSPGGKGKGGLVLQPLSNASLNIHLNMLELPKTAQEKIHDGRIGVAAAYELGKVPADKRAAVIERAEAEVSRQREMEEKDEERFLAQEKKLTTAQEEAGVAKGEMSAAEQAVQDAIALHAAKLEQLRAIQKNPMGDDRTYLELKPEEKGKVSEKIKAAELDVKGGEKAIKTAAQKVDQLKAKVGKAETLAEQVRKKLEEARNPKRKGTSGSGKKRDISAGDIRRAAAGEGAQAVKLNANDMRQVIDELASGENAVPKVAGIGVIIKACFDGIDTPKMMVGKLYQHMGLAVPKR